MGSVKYIVAKELKDLYALLGGAVTMAATSEGDNQVYWQEQVKLFKECCVDVWEQGRRGMTAKQFRKLVYEWFKQEIEHELTDCVAAIYMTEDAKKNTLKAAVDKWLEEGYHH